MRYGLAMLGDRDWPFSQYCGGLLEAQLQRPVPVHAALLKKSSVRSPISFQIPAPQRFDRTVPELQYLYSRTGSVHWSLASVYDNQVRNFRPFPALAGGFFFLSRV